MATQVKRPPVDSFFKPARKFPKRGPNGFPIGKRYARRQKENRQLRKLKINRCEIKLRGICADRIMLTWAHSKKSRFLVTSKDWQEAARCCIPCHQAVEAMSHAKMHKLITDAIANRK